MARQRMMQRFARWHIWLGWLVGVPVLMWTVTGLIMAARPLEEVRGEHLRASAEATIDATGVAFPAIDEPLESARLVVRGGYPAWVITTADGTISLRDARTGSFIPSVTREEARGIAEAAYAGEAAFASATFFPLAEEPQELRRGRSSWRVEYDDGTRVYVDDITGEVLAFRTSWWRTFDFMYGLHIMNLETRSGSHHPILIIFAVLSVIGALLGCILMFRRRKAPPK